MATRLTLRNSNTTRLREPGRSAGLGQPPRLSRPAVVLLGSAGPPQLTAALLDLADRGYLDVWYQHLDTGRPREVSDVLFERVPEQPHSPRFRDDLTDAEAELLERVFSHGDCVAVDTLRRLAMRWPSGLVGQLAEKVQVEPGERSSPAAGRSLWPLLGLPCLLGMIIAVVIAALGVVDVGWAVGLALASILGAIVAERGSRRSSPGQGRGRTETLAGRELLAYRARLVQLADGKPLQTPADYQELFGPHHAWAIALEVVPDWLALRHRQPDPWAGAHSRFNTRAVSVRRARKLPVARREASVRFVHRVPHPRHPQE